MIFENIRNLREDNDKTQQEIADYLTGRFERAVILFFILLFFCMKKSE